MKHIISFYDPNNCPLYDLIKQGKKTVEGRRNVKKYQDIKKNDILIIDYPKKGLLECIVTYVNVYKDVKEYLEKETVKKAVPCVNTVSDGLNIYKQFLGSEKINSSFLGIGIKLIRERKIYNISIQDPWFTQISIGKKIVEGRLNKGLFRKLKTGDIVIWFNRKNNKKFRTEILKTVVYKTFKEMIEKEGIKNILPIIDNINDGIKVYRQWYSEEMEKEFGVLGIHLRKTKI